MARVPPTWRRAVANTAEIVEDNVDSEADEFIVMCDGGWFGWYQRHHRRFEVRLFDLRLRSTTLDKMQE